MPNKIIGSHAPNNGEKLDLFTKTEKILSKKINIKPNVIPKARLIPIPPLLLKEERVFLRKSLNIVIFILRLNIFVFQI